MLMPQLCGKGNWKYIGYTTIDKCQELIIEHHDFHLNLWRQSHKFGWLSYDLNLKYYGLQVTVSKKQMEFDKVITIDQFIQSTMKRDTIVH